MTSAAMRELERAMELLAQVVADHDAAGEHDGANVRFETIDDVREFLGDPGPIATEPQHRKARPDDPKPVRRGSLLEPFDFQVVRRGLDLMDPRAVNLNTGNPYQPEAEAAFERIVAEYQRLKEVVG